MAESPALIDNIEPLLERYDAFFVDQFGVIYDKASVWPEARAALATLVEHGKSVVVLSNSGRRAAPNIERLASFGIERALFTGLISSGEVAWQGLCFRDDPALADLGRCCVLFSRGGDRTCVHGLDLVLADSADDADFVFLAGLDADAGTRERCAAVLMAALRRDLPVLCTNPDLISLEAEGRVEGPGTLAMRHAAAGGEVRYVGKPWPAIFAAALDLVDVPPERVAMIGDSLDHDITGAARAGIDGVLVLKGVHAEAFEGARDAADIQARLARLRADVASAPAWLLPSFR